MTVNNATFQPRWPTLVWAIGELKIYSAVALVCAVGVLASGIVVAAPMWTLTALAVAISLTCAFIYLGAGQLPHRLPSRRADGYASDKRLEIRDLQSELEVFRLQLQAQSERLREENDRLIEEIEELRLELTSKKVKSRKSITQKQALTVSSAISRSARRRVSRRLHSSSSA